MPRDECMAIRFEVVHLFIINWVRFVAKYVNSTIFLLAFQVQEYMTIKVNKYAFNINQVGSYILGYEDSGI